MNSTTLGKRPLRMLAVLAALTVPLTLQAADTPSDAAPALEQAARVATQGRTGPETQAWVGAWTGFEIETLDVAADGTYRMADAGAGRETGRWTAERGELVLIPDAAIDAPRYRRLPDEPWSEQADATVAYGLQRDKGHAALEACPFLHRIDHQWDWAGLVGMSLQAREAREKHPERIAKAWDPVETARLAMNREVSTWLDADEAGRKIETTQRDAAIDAYLGQFIDAMLLASDARPKSATELPWLDRCADRAKPPSVVRVMHVLRAPGTRHLSADRAEWTFSASDGGTRLEDGARELYVAVTGDGVLQTIAIHQPDADAFVLKDFPTDPKQVIALVYDQWARTAPIADAPRRWRRGKDGLEAIGSDGKTAETVQLRSGEDEVAK